MDIGKSVKGITLIALTITIIVLLILAGISLVLLNNLMIEKAILASNKTIEVSFQEQIEMAWVDCTASYLSDVRENPNLVKQDYFNEKFLANLQSLENVKKVSISGSVEDVVYIKLDYKNQTYNFSISPEGRAECIYLLKGNVKIGDYIEYPIEYDDVYSKQHYTVTTGWRVIDDGVMKGTSGEVRIISTGIPVKWHYDSSLFDSGKQAVHDLINNFEDLDLLDSVNGGNTKGSDFKHEVIANKVTTISLSELNNAYNQFNKENRKSNDTSILKNKDELFYLSNPDAYYWLATSSIENNKNLYYVTNGEIRNDLDFRIGIRPVICLKEHLTGTRNSNVWKINY